MTYYVGEAAVEGGDGQRVPAFRTLPVPPEGISSLQTLELQQVKVLLKTTRKRFCSKTDKESYLCCLLGAARTPNFQSGKVNAFPSFLPSFLPSSLQMFLEKAGKYDRHRRLRSLKREANWMEAMAPPPKRTSNARLEKEVVS